MRWTPRQALGKREGVQQETLWDAATARGYDTPGNTHQARLLRSPHRYIWPAELDLMAQLAGLELETRHADWSGTEFTADSRSHVSVYRKPPE
jgi:hypothetical protein